jgi:hypothetical protein
LTSDKNSIRGYFYIIMAYAIIKKNLILGHVGKVNIRLSNQLYV